MLVRLISLKPSALQFLHAGLVCTAANQAGVRMLVVWSGDYLNILLQLLQLGGLLNCFVAVIKLVMLGFQGGRLLKAGLLSAQACKLL